LVHSIGTCGGDSGGPLYKVQLNKKTNEKEYVLVKKSLQELSFLK
jgi:hypothetical protein